MERIAPSLYSPYPSVKLYLEDLEEIETIVQGFRGLRFEVGEYKFKNINELSEQYPNHQFSGLSIWSLCPHIDLKIGSYDCSLYCGDFKDQTNKSGVFYRLDRILKRSIRQPRLFYSIKGRLIFMRGISIANILFALWLISIGVVGFYSWETPHYVGLVTDKKLFWPVVYASLTLSAVTAILGLCVPYIGKSMVIISKRHQRQNFAKRNRDYIVAAVGSIIGAVAATIITLLLQNLLKS